MKAQSRLLILCIGAVFVFVISAATAYGYFDVLDDSAGNELGTGEWQSSNGLIAYLNSRDTSLTTGGTADDALDYYASLFFDQPVFNSEGKLASGELKSAYSGYSENDVKKLIDAAAEYGKSFLAPDTAGAPRLLSAGNVSEVSVPVVALQAGASAQIQKILLPADLTDDIYWAPITYTVSIELPGYDISDWAAELLYTPPGGAGYTFSYQYLIRDATSYNVNRAQGQIEKASNALSLIHSDVFVSLSVFRPKNNAYASSTFVHTLKKPSYGSWCRFVSGPNLKLGAPSGSTTGSQQQLEALTPATRTGLILMGKSNGTKVEARVGFYNRGTAASQIAAIPLIISVSRGTSAGHSPDLSIVPIIKIRAFAGDVWSG